MPNINNKIPIVSLNKSDICSNTEHPIPSQELNPSSKNIPQTRCAISLINRPQPSCCHNFSVVIFLLQFFFCNFFAVIFLPHFLCCDFSTAIFLPHFLCLDFSTTIFLPQFFCHNFFVALFLPHFFCHSFPATLFLLHFSYRIFLYQ
jgi:hypothetical protein